MSIHFSQQSIFAFKQSLSHLEVGDITDPSKQLRTRGIAAPRLTQ